MFQSKIFKSCTLSLIVFLFILIVPKNANAEILHNEFSESSINTALASKTATIKGSDVLLIGESFIALSHDITKYLEEDARNAGVLTNNEKFRDYAVSGTKLSGGIYPSIPDQYKNATAQSKVKYVIMDGGGNDCLQSTDQYAQDATNALKNLLAQMKKDEVLKVIYFFYPDPQSNLGGLKDRLDILRPQIQSIVNNNVSPKCYWLDLRPIFAGKYSQYINADGIHPTAAGSKAAADAIWKVIQNNNVFDNMSDDEEPNEPQQLGNLKVQESNASLAGITNTLSPKLKLINTGNTAINLSDVKIRYYYTMDNEKEQNFTCDWSSIGANNVNGTFVKMPIAKPGADCYLEIGFGSGAGSLGAGQSIDIQSRINRTDWTNYSQTGDYSFNSTSSAYSDWNKVTAYLSGNLNWGIEP